jgi:hypothetical protein
MSITELLLVYYMYMRMYVEAVDAMRSCTENSREDRVCSAQEAYEKMVTARRALEEEVSREINPTLMVKLQHSLGFHCDEKAFGDSNDLAILKTFLELINKPKFIEGRVFKMRDDVTGEIRKQVGTTNRCIELYYTIHTWAQCRIQPGIFTLPALADPLVKINVVLDCHAKATKLESNRIAVLCKSTFGVPVLVEIRT